LGHWTGLGGSLDACAGGVKAKARSPTSPEIFADVELNRKGAKVAELEMGLAGSAFRANPFSFL
jgi:hypothetical protein